MFEETLKPRVALWAHIAAGVFVGTVAANAATWAGTLWMAHLAARDAQEKISLDAERRRQASEAERQQSEAQQRARQLLQAQQQRDAEQRKQQVLAEAERRELAWARYYRKPFACDEAKGGVWSVECANDYIRAKANFQALYDAGKL